MRPCLTYPPWASLLSAVLLKYLHAWAQDMVQTNILCHRDKLETRTARVSLFWFFLISCLAKNIQARTRAWALHKTCEPGCSSPALASKQRLISLSLSLSLFLSPHGSLSVALKAELSGYNVAGSSGCILVVFQCKYCNLNVTRWIFQQGSPLDSGAMGSYTPPCMYKRTRMSAKGRRRRRDCSRSHGFFFPFSSTCVRLTRDFYTISLARSHQIVDRYI